MGVVSFFQKKWDYLTSNFNHFYLIPLFGFVCWYTMCIALVALWYADGSPAYPQYDELDKPLPLERIGAILSPYFFNIFIFIHAVIFCLSMYLEYFHRKIGKLIKFAKPHLQTKLAHWSLAIGILAQLFFLVQAVVGTVYVKAGKRSASHYAVLLGIFGILVLVSLALNFVNYYIMGQYYRLYVNGERWNKFMVSFIIKVCWWIVTIVLAITTCVFYAKNNQKVSNILEWAFHFWYGILLVFWTYDLYPITELRALREKANGKVSSKGKNIIDKLPWRKKSEVRHSIVEVASSLGDSNSTSSPNSPIFDYIAQKPESLST